MATTGPTSAADKNGERSQRTASIRLSDAMTEKGMSVEDIAIGRRRKKGSGAGRGAASGGREGARGGGGAEPGAQRTGETRERAAPATRASSASQPTPSRSPSRLATTVAAAPSA